MICTAENLDITSTTGSVIGDYIQLATSIFNMMVFTFFLVLIASTLLQALYTPRPKSYILMIQVGVQSVFLWHFVHFELISGYIHILKITTWNAKYVFYLVFEIITHVVSYAFLVFATIRFYAYFILERSPALEFEYIGNLIALGIISFILNALCFFEIERKSRLWECLRRPTPFERFFANSQEECV